jgi:L-threonylcarbamoyladenylate synthase
MISFIQEQKSNMKFQNSLIINRILRSGVVAIPTDTIQGLSCSPDDDLALRKVIKLKKRAKSKGLILLANKTIFFKRYVKNISDLKKIGKDKIPTTYLVDSKRGVSRLIKGSHRTIAIRLTDDPLISALCDRLKSPIVSTSANISGKSLLTSLFELRQTFQNELDYMVKPSNYNGTPSQIINLKTGEKIR